MTKATTHIVFSAVWLIYSIAVYLLTHDRQKGVSMWAYVGVVNSTIWVATM